MSDIECPFEADLVDAIHASRWPAAANPNLVRHVETCSICRDVAAVLTAVLELVDADAERAPAVPEAGAVWLRAQIRARAEAERAVARPMTAAQAVALAGATALIGAFFGATSSWFQAQVAGLLAGVGAWWATAALPEVLATTLSTHLAVTVGVAIAITLAPVAAYLVTRD